MAPLSQKKRKVEDAMRGKTSKPRKRIRKQKEYHSSSEDDEGSDPGFTPVTLQDSDEERRLPNKKEKKSKRIEQPPDESSASESDEASATSGSEDDSDVDGELGPSKKKKSKRNDPEAFSTSMSKILSTKLSRSAKQDPLLSRSREAAQAGTAAANARLEQKARAKLRAEKKEEMQRGRITDVLGIERGISGAVAEEEKRLRKIAQKGVIQLFNAFHAAHMRAEQAAKEERRKGTVGMANREEKINEMSKQGFLDLIGGKKKDVEPQEA